MLKLSVPVACSVVLEKTLESPLGCKEIQPVHSKGDQSWVFIHEFESTPGVGDGQGGLLLLLLLLLSHFSV